jgi:hypothetical protein
VLERSWAGEVLPHLDHTALGANPISRSGSALLSRGKCLAATVHPYAGVCTHQEADIKDAMRAIELHHFKPLKLRGSTG